MGEPIAGQIPQFLPLRFRGNGVRSEQVRHRLAVEEEAIGREKRGDPLGELISNQCVESDLVTLSGRV